MGYKIIRFRSEDAREDVMSLLHKATEMLDDACELLKQHSEISERGGMSYRRDSRGRYAPSRREAMDYRGNEFEEDDGYRRSRYGF